MGCGGSSTFKAIPDRYKTLDDVYLLIFLNFDKYVVLGSI